MATTNDVKLEVPDKEDAELQADAEKLEKMAKAAEKEKKNKDKNKSANDPLVAAVPRKTEVIKEPTTTVNLPELPGGDGSMKIDVYEHVTIANEEKEDCFKVKRGEPVEVPIPVFIQLKNRHKC